MAYKAIKFFLRHMQILLKVWLLLAVLSTHASTQAAPPDKHCEVQLGPGHTLKLWFNPRYAWRAKSYDQRYPGCTRQQEHRVYTADNVVLPRMLRNPNNLHWLSDPEQAGGKALYIGQLGLAGGMPPSKRVKNQARKDLSTIAVQATEQGKMGAFRRALDEAQEGADFDGVYEQVFGEGSSEEVDLAIFDLTVGEVRELSGYSQFSAVGGLVGAVEEQGRDAEDEHSVLGPADLVEGLYASVQSHQHQTACKLLKSKKYEPAYSKVLPLTAGLLYKKYTDGEDAEAYGLHVFWHHVLSDPRELVGIHQVVLNMCCMEACDADDKGVLAKLHKPILNDITSWTLAAWGVKTQKGLTPALLPLLEAVWGTCPCVLAYEPLVEGVFSTLENWNKAPQVSEKITLGSLRTLARLVDAAWPSFVKKAVFDYVLAHCKHQSWEVRRAAARGLAKGLQKCSQETYKGIVQALKRLCKDKEYWVRQAAAGGLSKALDKCSDQACEGILKVLTRLCKDKEYWVRQAAAGGLSKALDKCSDQACKSILEALTRLCRDKDWSIRKSAAAGLSKALETQCSEEACKCIVYTLTGLCQDKEYWVRQAAALGLSKALDKCSEESRQAIVEALTDLCQDKHSDVCKSAAEGLSKALGAKCSDQTWQGIVKALTRLSKSKKYWVRQAAAEGLAKALAGKCAEEAWHTRVEAVKGLCKDDSRWVRQAATGALSKGLGDKCVEAGWKSIVDALTSLCRDRYSNVRRAAAGALSKALSKCSEEGWQGIVEALTRLSKDEKYWVRQVAAGALSKTLEGQCSQEAWSARLEVLTRLCRDDSEWVRQAAAGALSQGLSSKCSQEAWHGRVEVLTQLCKNDSIWVRQAAAGALSQGLGSKCSQEAWQDRIEALIHLSKNENVWVRRAAAGACSKALQGTCSEVACQSILETLQGLCKDEERDVRRSAYDVLVKLLCRGYGDESVLEQAFATLAQSFGYGGFWDIPGPVYASLHALLFGTPIDAKLRAQGWRMLCEGCNQGSGTPRLAIESLSKVLLRVELSVKELEQGLLVLFRTCVDGAGNAQGIADHALVCLMDKHQGLLVDMLMGSDLPSLTLIEAMTSYNPCLLLPDQCDSEVSGRIKRSFSQERKERGWPEALLSVEDLPSSVPSKKDKGIFMESDKLEE